MYYKKLKPKAGMMSITPQIGLLLVNLGTPQSDRPKDVFRYLNEFLTDGRVMDLPWLKRQLLVRGVIVPFRYKQSADLYQKLWTKEGSPLLVHGKNVQNKLQEVLGCQFKVALAMRYQHPSIKAGLEELRESHVKDILVLPLFPQYASATTGSVHQHVMEHIKHWPVIPKMTFINSYADHPSFIEALCERGKQYEIPNYDHILLSFHGLPERQLRAADRRQYCLTTGCCEQLNSYNQFCYKAQCFATARALIQQLKIKEGTYTVCFQSRLGKDPWIQPYTSDVIAQCTERGHKRLLVFCPAFVCDCLETTVEIAHEYGQEFKRKGGEMLQLVEGLNSHPSWIKALKIITLEHCSSEYANV
jgi:ferrochelatase